MLGNAGEWCRDWYSSVYYSRAAGVTDPTGPEQGESRIWRGGMARDAARMVTFTKRFKQDPTRSHKQVGFRTIIELEG